MGGGLIMIMLLDLVFKKVKIIPGNDQEKISVWLCVEVISINENKSAGIYGVHFEPKLFSYE